MALPKNLTNPQQWCLPAIIYAILILAYIVGIIFKTQGTTEDKAYRIIMQLLMAFIVVVIMLIACNAGHEWISWMMMVIPLVWIAGIAMGFKACVDQKGN